MPTYIIRHAECEANVTEIFTGAFESPLSMCGLEQLVHLGDHLSTIEFNKIYVSPLNRARETASVLKGPILIIPELIEMYGGDWEGKTLDQLATVDSFVNFFSALDNGVAPNGESIADMRKRLIPVKRLLRESNNSENIAIVAHGIIIMALASELLGVSIKQLPMLYNASVSILDFNEDKFTVRDWGNDTFIPQEARQSKRRH